jgi:hypothetical protein
MAEFHHYGVPTQTKQPNEVYMDGMKLHLTDPMSHPFKIEFLRFEADSQVPAPIQNTPHAAYVVDNLEEAMAGKEVILDATDVNDELRIAFVYDNEAVIELMEMKK